MADGVRGAQRDINLASEKIGGVLERLWRAGGLQLVGVFLGTVLLIAASFHQEGELSFYVLLGFGAGFLFLTMAVYYLAIIRPIADARLDLNKKAEFLDKLQVRSIEIAESADQLHQTIHQNAFVIAGGLKTATGAIRKIPVLGDQAADYLLKSENLSADIVFFSGRMKEIASDTAKAMRDSDERLLGECVARMREVSTEMRSRSGK